MRLLPTTRQGNDVTVRGPAARRIAAGRAGLTPERIVAVGVAALVLALAWVKLRTPLPTLLDVWIPDDAFYYFQTARHFARTGVSSFDGLHPTNGYQPLWFLLCTPVFWLYPGGGPTPVYLLLALQAALYLIGTLALLRVFRRRFGLAPAAAAMLVWIPCSFHIATNGLETALLIAVFAAVLDGYDRAFNRAGFEPTWRHYAWLGVGAGAVFLARTDSAFLVAALAVAVWFRSRRTPCAWRRWAAFLMPVALLAGGYLSINLLTTGHLMPVAGAAKIYHSALARAAAERERGPVAVRIENLRAMLNRPLLAGLVLPWGLAMAAWLTGGRLRRLRRLGRLWPFAVGVWGSYLFYGIAFHGGFSKTNWYFAPHAAMAALGVAAVPALWPPLLRNPLLAWLASLAAAGCILRWTPAHLWAQPALAAATLACAVAALQTRGRLFRVAGWVGLVAIAAEGWRRDLSPLAQLWMLLLYGPVVVGVVLRLVRAAPKAGALATATGWAVLVAAGNWPTWRYVVDRSAEPPSHWNYNLYLGALWAREHLPPDATIWSGSAGILGYFSERRCINTDGLINSYDYLENYLKAGKAYDYMRRWQYTIDAYPDDSLARIFPGGAFVDLPPELQRYPFADGALTRVLRVYKMPPPADGQDDP